MNSLVTTLSDAFGVDSGQVRAESAGVEIDRFDGWHLRSDGVVFVCTSCIVLRNAE